MVNNGSFPLLATMVIVFYRVMRYGNLVNLVKESFLAHTILVELSRREQSNISKFKRG